MFGKRQIIKFEQNLAKANIDDNSVLFVRVSDLIKDKGAQLEVSPNHNACLIKGGIERYYTSGVYDIFEDKKEIKNWKKGISVDVVYIQKETSIKILWGVGNINYRDKKSGYAIIIKTNGSSGINVYNNQQLMHRIIGVKKEFNVEEFQNRFKDVINNEVVDVLSNTLNNLSIDYTEFQSHKNKIAKEIEKSLSAKFENDYGLTLVDFIIDDIVISDVDKAKVEEESEIERYQKHKSIYDEMKKAKIDEDNREWQKQKDIMNNNVEMIKTLNSKKELGTNFCKSCGEQISSNTVFCPSCGRQVKNMEVVCKFCNSVNNSDNVYCSKCGKELR